VLWARCFCKVLSVRYAIFMSECLKIFVMNVVSLPMYVKVHHFFLFRGFVVVSCGCRGVLKFVGGFLDVNCGCQGDSEFVLGRNYYIVYSG